MLSHQTHMQGKRTEMGHVTQRNVVCFMVRETLRGSSYGGEVNEGYYGQL
jgi:hypothetical protein